ncbi:MAG: PAS domain S-box protein [bacterium]|nr:PAS domain S-box protein [bacterium]
MSKAGNETTEPKSPEKGFFGGSSIKRKLVLIIMLVSSAAMLVAGAAFITYQWMVVFPQRMLTDISAQATMVGDNCTGALSFMVPMDAEEVILTLKAIKPIALACIYDREAKSFAEYRRDDFKGASPTAPPKKEGARIEGDWLIMVKQVIMNDQLLGTVYMKSDLRELNTFLRKSIIALALMMLLTSLLALALSSRLQKVITNPLFHLAKVAGEVTETQDYSVRADKISEDEFGLLTDSFNNMLEQIEKSGHALLDSQERFKAIANYTYDWESWHAPDGKLLWVNPAVERITGYSMEECLQMENYPLPLVHEDDIHCIKEVMRKAGEEEVTGTGARFRIRNKEGTIQWMATSWLPIYNTEGAGLGYRTSIYDITARKHAEDELNRLRNLLSNIVNSMPSVLVGVDADGNVTQWNLEAERFTGISATEAQGSTLADVFPLMAGEMEKVKLAIRNRESLKDEKIKSMRDGEVRFADVTVYPLIANGVEGAVIRLDDVTERVRIEEMMIQSEKMMSVGGLAAGMAHEINNPLAGILQNVQVMRNRIKDDLPKNIRTAEECGTKLEVVRNYMEKRGLLTMIESIMESGRRAAQIVDNMLSFSRKSDSRLEPQNMKTLLDKTVDLASNDYDLKKKYDFRQIQLIRDYDDDAPDVLCEGSKIQQVFLNLLKNAAQAMAESERDEPPKFTLRVKKEDATVRIEIEDNGPGMDEATRKRVFEPFFTTKGVGVGTGLGLSVSYFIITENHKGAMSVESAAGKGTNFIIQLPINREG